MALELVDQPLVLVGPELPLPVRALVDDRPRRPCRVVEQRLRPGARRVVHVDRTRRRIQRRQPVVVVLRMEALHVQHRHPVLPHVEDVLASPDRVFVGHRPAIRARHHLHPVRAQHVELARPAGTDLPRRLDVPVARKQEVAVEELHQRRAALSGIGRGEQVEHRMHVEPPVDVLRHHRHRGRRLGDDLHAAERHRVAEKAHPGQRATVPRRPGDPPGALKGDHRRGSGGLRLRGRRGRLPAGHAKELQGHVRLLLGLRDAKGRGGQRPRTRGLRKFAAGSRISSVSAQTSASSRSGLPWPRKPATVISRICSSSARNSARCATRPCS